VVEGDNINLNSPAAKDLHHDMQQNRGCRPKLGNMIGLYSRRKKKKEQQTFEGVEQIRYKAEWEMNTAIVRVLPTALGETPRNLHGAEPNELGSQKTQLCGVDIKMEVL